MKNYFCVWELNLDTQGLFTLGRCLFANKRAVCYILRKNSYGTFSHREWVLVSVKLRLGVKRPFSRVMFTV